MQKLTFICRQWVTISKVQWTVYFSVSLHQKCGTTSATPSTASSTPHTHVQMWRHKNGDLVVMRVRVWLQMNTGTTITTTHMMYGRNTWYCIYLMSSGVDTVGFCDDYTESTFIFHCCNIPIWWWTDISSTEVKSFLTDVVNPLCWDDFDDIDQHYELLTDISDTI